MKMAQNIIARFIIEIAGKPVENVDKALNLVLDKLKKEEKNFEIIDSFVEEPELDEKTTLYLGFLEVTAKFEDMSKLLGFVLDYTPTSIEIEEPEKIKFDSLELTKILNDLSQSMLKSNAELRKHKAHIFMQNKKIEELQKKK